MERAEYVASAFETSGRQIARYIRQLRCDFRALKSGETIMGCKTWTEFCTKVLKRTDRAIRYIVAGGNPRWKRKPAEPKNDFNWKDHWRGMPEFVQPDLTPFKTIHVHFENQKDVDKFAKLVGQRITPETRYIYYPKAVKGHHADKRYVDAKNGEAAA